MTHMSLARSLKSDYRGLAIFALSIAAVSAIALALGVIFSDRSVRIMYGERAFGFTLTSTDNGISSIDGPWPFYCGIAVFMIMVVFIYAITGGAVFRSYLGGGMTRVSIWIVAVRDILTLALSATLILAIIAGICTLMQASPPTTGNSLNVWASLPIAFANYLAVGSAGFLLSLLFVAFHWAVGVLVILVTVFGVPTLLRSLDLDLLFRVVGNDSFTPAVVGLAWAFGAILTLVIALPIASRIPMRR